MDRFNTSLSSMFLDRFQHFLDLSGRTRQPVVLKSITNGADCAENGYGKGKVNQERQRMPPSFGKPFQKWVFLQAC